MGYQQQIDHLGVSFFWSISPSCLSSSFFVSKRQVSVMSSTLTSSLDPPRGGWSLLDFWASWANRPKLELEQTTRVWPTRKPAFKCEKNVGGALEGAAKIWTIHAIQAQHQPPATSSYTYSCPSSSSSSSSSSSWLNHLGIMYRFFGR